MAHHPDLRADDLDGNPDRHSDGAVALRPRRQRTRLRGIPAACVAAALAGLGTGIYNTYVFDHGVEISPPAYHGRAAGLLFAFMFFGAAINPFVAAAFKAGFGLHHSFLVMAIVALLCGLPVLLARSAPA